MSIQDLGMKAGVFFAGKGIGHAPHSIQLLGYLQSTSLLRTFEEHVLDEVGQAALAFLFITRAHIQPDTHGDRMKMGNPLSHHPHPIVKDGSFIQPDSPCLSSKYGCAMLSDISAKHRTIGKQVTVNSKLICLATVHLLP